MALSGLLGTGTVRSSEDAALPGATDDLCALTTELDACIAPQGLLAADTDIHPVVCAAVYVPLY